MPPDRDADGMPLDEDDAAFRLADQVNTCPLPWSAQRRNLILFATCTGLQYLAAPVLYVGITQASLCKWLGTNARTANLPGTLFFAMTAMPALLAWLSPRVSVLRRNLMLCYVTSGCMLAVTAGVLLLPVPASVKVAMVILQGGVSGAVMPTAIAFLWEIIGRGSDESRRGLALSLAFGLGPLLAVVGSLLQVVMLGGDLFGVHFEGMEPPQSFALLYAACAPVMLAAAVMSQFFVVPAVEVEPRREPLGAVAGLLVGLPLMFVSVLLVQAADLLSQPELEATVHAASSGVLLPYLLSYTGYGLAAAAAAALMYHFRSILRQRVLLLATVVTILLYAGNTISSNMNLYSQEVLGNSPDKYAGLQNMLRFGFKMVTGAGLGWLLMRTNARAGILMTALIFLSAQIWAMCVTGPWYLLAFGIYGAGELVGVYAPNYICSASRPHELRRNMAFVTMLMVPAAPTGYVFGAIVDLVKSRGWTLYGMSNVALGFRLSFLACALLIFTGIVFAILWLPKQPRSA